MYVVHILRYIIRGILATVNILYSYSRMHPCHRSRILSFFICLFICFNCMEFAFLYICVPLACLVHAEDRREHAILGNENYRWLWSTMLVVRIKPLYPGTVPRAQNWWDISLAFFILKSIFIVVTAKCKCVYKLLYILHTCNNTWKPKEEVRCPRIRVRSICDPFISTQMLGIEHGCWELI